MCIMCGGTGYLVVVGLFPACVLCSLFDKSLVLWHVIAICFSIVSKDLRYILILYSWKF